MAGIVAFDEKEWLLPENIPDIVFDSDVISIDLETHDPNIKVLVQVGQETMDKLSALPWLLKGGKVTFP